MVDNNNSESKMLSGSYLIGEWTFQSQVFQLIRGQDVIKLEPRVAHLLTHLSENPGIAVSREVLMEEVWPGMIVGDEALTNAINKLRKAFSDDSHHPKFIETIPKLGYRLIAPVEPISKLDSPSINSIKTTTTSWGLKQSLLVVLPIVILTALWFGLNESYTPISQGNTQSQHPIAKVDLSLVPTLAVLPFENLSQDLQQEYFVDGISEDTITDLSRISNLQVLGRNTTLRFKGQTIDPQQLGKDLKASHILEGSVRKSASSLRITARLVDTKTGHQIWVERYDRQLNDIFKVQDDVTQNIIKSLSVKLTSRDTELLGQAISKNFEAYDLFLQGRWTINERTQEANQQAQDIYRQAIKQDPSYSRPYGALAVAIMRTVISGWSSSVEEDKNRALTLALKATELDNKSQTAYWALAFTYLYRKEHIDAIRAVKQAMINAPSFADGLALMAFINNYLGNAEEAIGQIQKAMQLNPLYAYDYLYNLGWAHYTLGEYDKATELLEEALDRNENALNPRLILAVSYIGAGNQDDAEWQVEMIMANRPEMSVGYISKEFPFAEGGKKDKIMQYLRKAGLPE